MIKMYVICFFLLISLLTNGQILNAYAKVTAISGGNVLTVTNVDQTNHNFIAGEKVIIMQMQDDVIGGNTANTASFGNLSIIANAGRYEIGVISSRIPGVGSPTSITLSSALVNAYNTGANSSVQVISFRNMGANYTTVANIIGLPWNGNVGGVIAFEVTNTLTLQNNISANGIGFLGGLRNPNSYTNCDDVTYVAAIGNRYAGKGEGIYKNTNAAFAGARGKILNGGGGGNDVNAGGGGGGNFTTGGTGGVGWNSTLGGCSPTAGGLGGLSLSPQISTSSIFMGGGGGSGHQNDNNGTSGGNGGGIILIKANTLITAVCAGISITADGISPPLAGNDGAGGGGAGGSIVLQIANFTVPGACPVTISSNGGTGGASNTSGSAHGGGGGGGQGTVIFSVMQPTANVTATTLLGGGGSSCSGCAASTSGVSGTGPNNAGILAGVSGPLPIELISFLGEPEFESIKLKWITATEINNDYFVLEKSLDGTNFVPLGTVKGVGNSLREHQYNFTDTKPNPINYYQLQQIDLDGRSFYSQIIMIETEIGFTYSIFPNPLNNTSDLTIKLEKTAHADVDITIYDITGKQIINRVVNTSREKFITLNFQNQSLGKGIYMVRFFTGSVSKTQKLVIE